MYIRGVILVIFSSLTQILWVPFFGRSIDAITSGHATPSTVLEQAGIIVALAFISGFLYYRVRQNIIVACRYIEYDIRNDLLAHVERLSMRFFQNTPQGELMAYATNDIEAVRFFVGPSIMYTADTITTFLAAFGFMLALNPTLAIAAVLPLPLMSIGVYFIGRKVQPLFSSVQEHFATMTGRTTESISGIRIVRAYVREAYETSIFNGLAKGYFDKNMKLAKMQGLMQPIIFFFMGFSTIVLLIIGGRLIIAHKLTVGQLSDFIIYLGMLTWPFIAIGYVTNMIQRGAASMGRLAKLFETKPEIENTQHTNWQITELRGDIEFNSLTFRYRPELQPVLDQISLRIPTGTTLAIIGRTGSGKTTFVNLIARLFDPTEGSITIDGHDLRTIPLEVLRSQIGFVTQEPFLFSETIEENIAFGTKEAERLDAKGRILGTTITESMSGFPKITPPSPLGTEEAARSADIYDNVMEFPEQFHTMIGERGITLSGGQKQRTAIARALARNPKILVLDDAMSAVDTATEERILSNLRTDSNIRTTILISHRTSTAREADTIIVLDDGHIIEQGTHDELLELGGQYFDLYQRQLLEEELEHVN